MCSVLTATHFTMALGVAADSRTPSPGTAPARLTTTAIPSAANLRRVEIVEKDGVESYESGTGSGARSGAESARSGSESARTVTRIFSGFGETTERPLLISAGGLDDKTVAMLEEDLNIMARVIEKAMDRGGSDDRRAMGIHLWTLNQGGARGARNLYVDGHGAIFMVTVNMPLVAPISKGKPEESIEPASSTWEQARNELYGRDDDGRQESKSHPFDAERLETLKTSLTEALKNATHIRGVKENEFVTIVVQGPINEGAGWRSRAGTGKGEARVDPFAIAGLGTFGGGRTTLTIRAKKSDIDACSKGKLDADDFRKKVLMAALQTGGAMEGGRTRP